MVEPIPEERALRGETAVYPGHPLTVGLVIMAEFDSLENAERVQDEDTAVCVGGCAAALANSNVPGAGSEVSRALKLLRRVADGEVAPENAPEEAERLWRHSQAGGHLDKIESGQEQANRMADLYVGQVSTWAFAPPTPSA